MVDYVMVARLKPDHKPWRISKGRGWLACEDPEGKIGRHTSRKAANSVWTRMRTCSGLVKP
jgi:hypothetical protein